jgi:hypothetical protein
MSRAGSSSWPGPRTLPRGPPELAEDALGRAATPAGRTTSLPHITSTPATGAA